MIQSVKKILKRLLDGILSRSLDAAAKDQELTELSSRLGEIVPDLTDQYSQFEVSGGLLEKKVRNQHAFQMSLAAVALENIDDPVIVDIGDSAGTHLLYLKCLYEKKKDFRALSVNLDEKAVEKIRAKGLEAVNARAEDLAQYDINASIFLCFETLEHLSDPIGFLRSLSSSSDTSLLVITVPFVTQSRVGLHHIRQGRLEAVFAENTHIFELSPDDWKLLFNHCGWDVLSERIYLQYPRGLRSFFLKWLWRWVDFEGFFGVVLRHNNIWTTTYKDW